MNETNKKNPAIAWGNMKPAEKELIVEQGEYGPSKNEINNLAGMEIKVEGYEIILDEKLGKVLRIKDNRTIGEVIDDRRRQKIIDTMKQEVKREGIENLI